MTGLTDQARNDFKVMKVSLDVCCVHVSLVVIALKDLATYTRLTPNERDKSFKKFVHTINTNPKVS